MCMHVEGMTPKYTYNVFWGGLGAAIMSGRRITQSLAFSSFGL